MIKTLLSDKRNAMILLLTVLCLALPYVLSSPYTLQIFILIYLYAAAAGAWNLIGGYAGQVSLGHVAFFGIGAYTSTLLYINFGLSPWIGLFAGGILASAVACAISYPCFKLRGPFFTLATLAFAEVLRLLSIWARELTGGSVGLTILYKPSFASMQFPGKTPYYYIAFFLMLLVLLVSVLVQRSRFGYYLVALKEDNDAAEALGINTARYKLYAAGISGFLTAICGSFYAQLLLYVEPAAVFTNTLSNQFAMISVVGGTGTAWGAVVGSALITPLNELLRGWLGGSLQGANYVIFGVVLILVVTFMPHGIIGFARDIWDRWKTGKPNKPGTPGGQG